MNLSEELRSLLFNFSWDTHLVKVENHSGKITDEQSIEKYTILYDKVEKTISEIFKRGQAEALQELSRKSERHESDGICNSEFYISTDYIHERINELKASLEEGGK